LNASTTITVVAGQNRTGVDIILNGTPARFDPFDDVAGGSKGVRFENKVQTTGGAK
jgi:methionine synthase II (cobalamin-independent)